MEVSDHTLTELLRLTQENNKMLHKMRRNALWGSIIKFLIYTGLFVALPIWLYMIYLAPVIKAMQETASQIQGTGAKAQAQFSELQSLFDKFKSNFPGQN